MSCLARYFWQIFSISIEWLDFDWGEITNFLLFRNLGIPLNIDVTKIAIIEVVHLIS